MPAFMILSIAFVEPVRSLLYNRQYKIYFKR